jgi:hypothetical protein
MKAASEWIELRKRCIPPIGTQVYHWLGNGGGMVTLEVIPASMLRGSKFTHRMDCRVFLLTSGVKNYVGPLSDLARAFNTGSAWGREFYFEPTKIGTGVVSDFAKAIVDNCSVMRVVQKDHGAVMARKWGSKEEVAIDILLEGSKKSFAEFVGLAELSKYGCGCRRGLKALVTDSEPEFGEFDGEDFFKAKAEPPKVSVAPVFPVSGRSIGVESAKVLGVAIVMDQPGNPLYGFQPLGDPSERSADYSKCLKNAANELGLEEHVLMMKLGKGLSICAVQRKVEVSYEMVEDIG